MKDVYFIDSLINCSVLRCVRLYVSLNCIFLILNAHNSSGNNSFTPYQISKLPLIYNELVLRYLYATPTNYSIDSPLDAGEKREE